jgi:hypothetical protein
MAKKKSRKSSKKDAFSGFKRDKKSLKGPFTQISERSPGFWKKSSWHDVQMPEFLWVALILGAFDTNDAIQRLRRIAQHWPDISAFDGKLCQPGSLSAIAALKPIARESLLARYWKWSNQSLCLLHCVICRNFLRVTNGVHSSPRRK